MRDKPTLLRGLPQEYRDEIKDFTPEKLGIEVRLENGSWLLYLPWREHTPSCGSEEAASWNAEYAAQLHALKWLVKKHGRCSVEIYQSRGPSVRCDRPAYEDGRCKQHAVGHERSMKIRADKAVARVVKKTREDGYAARAEALTKALGVKVAVNWRVGYGSDLGGYTEHGVITLADLEALVVRIDGLLDDLEDRDK